MSSRGLESQSAQTPQLESVLAEGLDVPLAALRASLESLNRTLPYQGSEEGPLAGVIDEVQRLGRNVRDLVEYTCQRSPLPMRSTPNEIALSALRALEPEHRGRVTLARAETTGTMSTDAAMLARSLRRVIENALEAGSDEVLLIVRQRDGWTTFSVVDAGATSLDEERAVLAFHSTKRRHLGLGLALARRDVALMGGSLELGRTEQRETNVRVRVPDEIPPTSELTAGGAA